MKHSIEELFTEVEAQAARGVAYAVAQGGQLGGRGQVITMTGAAFAEVEMVPAARVSVVFRVTSKLGANGHPLVVIVPPDWVTRRDGDGPRTAWTEAGLKKIQRRRLNAVGLDQDYEIDDDMDDLDYAGVGA